MKVSKKEITFKAVSYRVFVIIYEVLLGALIGYLGFSITAFVVINNIIKLIGYIVFEMIWFGYLRTRLNIAKRVKEWLKIKESET